MNVFGTVGPWMAYFFLNEIEGEQSLNFSTEKCLHANQWPHHNRFSSENSIFTIVVHVFQYSMLHLIKDCHTRSLTSIFYSVS